MECDKKDCEHYSKKDRNNCKVVMHPPARRDCVLYEKKKK